MCRAEFLSMPRRVSQCGRTRRFAAHFTCPKSPGRPRQTLHQNTFHANVRMRNHTVRYPIAVNDHGPGPPSSGPRTIQQPIARPTQRRPTDHLHPGPAIRPAVSLLGRPIDPPSDKLLPLPPTAFRTPSAHRHPRSTARRTAQPPANSAFSRIPQRHPRTEPPSPLPRTRLPTLAAQPTQNRPAEHAARTRYPRLREQPRTGRPPDWNASVGPSQSETMCGRAPRGHTRYLAAQSL